MVSQLTIKTIVGPATPESGLVQADLQTIPIRVDKRHKAGIMAANSLKRCVTFSSAEILDKTKLSSFSVLTSHRFLTDSKISVHRPS